MTKIDQDPQTLSESSCPCGSSLPFEDCCGPFLKGEKLPPTAEQLMRSRYTAFTRVDLAYIQNTLAPESRKGFDLKALELSARKVSWKSLTIVATEKGGSDDVTGMVEFKATYESEAEMIEHHEFSQFRKD